MESESKIRQRAERYRRIASAMLNRDIAREIEQIADDYEFAGGTASRGHDFARAANY
jgi:hypothetical protein